MALVDKIEELGAAVDADLLPRETAIQQLAEYSDGGLTNLGAASAIDNWQTRRAAYSDILMRAEMSLAAVESAMRARGER